MTGVALLVASLVAGALWDMTGPQGTFLSGAGFALLTIADMFVIRLRRAHRLFFQDKGQIIGRHAVT